MYLLHIVTIKDVISLDNCDKIDCIDTVKKYTEHYLWDNSQHVFAEVQSQCEYTAADLTCISENSLLDHSPVKIVWE